MATIAAIRKSVFVQGAPERAFAVFTEGIDSWWPRDRYGVFGEEGESERVAFENGGLVEHGTRGRKTTWGEVVVWEPPTRIVLAWHPGHSADEMPTELEVTFVAEAGGTRVELEHRGWERLAEERRAVRAGYDEGWPEVLACFQEAANTA